MLITGGSRGLGLVLAREAGAGRRSGRDLRARSARRSSAPARTWSDGALECWPSRATSRFVSDVERDGPRGRRATGSDRRPDQQRGRHQRRTRGDHGGRGLPAGHGHQLLGGAPHDPRGAPRHAATGRGTDREHRVHRRQDQRAAPRSLQREQVRAGRTVGRPAGRAGQGWHLGHHDLSRSHAHRQPAPRDLQGPPSGGVRLVQHQRRLAAACPWTPTGPPARSSTRSGEGRPSACCRCRRGSRPWHGRSSRR